MSLQIRLWDRHDLKDVERIANQSQSNSWSHAVFEDCLKMNYLGWVLEDDAGGIIGFLIVLIHDRECQLMNIAIDRLKQHQGYAKKLLSHLFDYVKTTQVEHILLEVRASNEAAICLYKSHHFSQVGIRKGYYPTAGGKEDALVFMRV